MGILELVVSEMANERPGFLHECVYMDLLFQQHDSPTGLDGADFSVFVHGNHEQAVHHPLLTFTGVHQQVCSARGAGCLDGAVKKLLIAQQRVA